MSRVKIKNNGLVKLTITKDEAYAVCRILACRNSLRDHEDFNGKAMTYKIWNDLDDALPCEDNPFADAVLRNCNGSPIPAFYFDKEGGE